MLWTNEKCMCIYIKFFLKVRESCVMSANNKRFHVVINSISSCAWTKDCRHKLNLPIINKTYKKLGIPEKKNINILLPFS